MDSCLLKVSFNMPGLLKKFLFNNKLGRCDMVERRGGKALLALRRTPFHIAAYVRFSGPRVFRADFAQTSCRSAENK
jgi:hypothetical protein